MSCMLTVPDRPAFLVGITGHMDLRPEEIEPLKERVRLLFRLLKPARETDGEDDPSADKRWSDDLESLVSELPDAAGLTGGEDKKRPYRAALAQWPRLKHTPVVVLTSLAPGADALVAEVALEDQFQQADFFVVAALPLPVKHYVESTSFVWNEASDEDNKQRQAKFRELLTRIPPGNHFVVHLADDMKLTAVELEERHRRAATGETFKSERHQRYLAAGEYMAAYSHLMIAIWDHHHDANTDVGTAAIVEARRSGPTPGLLPTTDPLAMPHGGPAIHLYTRRLKNQQIPNAAPCPVRFLQARNIEHDRDGDDNDVAWQQQGLTLMARIADNLDRFNERAVSAAKVNQELCNRLTYRAASGSLECFSGELRAHSQPLFAPLRRLAAVRKAASEMNRNIVEESGTTMRWLFFLTILAAFALDFFAHWHPQNEPHDAVAAAADQPHDAAAAGTQPSGLSESEHDPNKTHQWLLLWWLAGWVSKPWIGTISALAACLALLWYWRRRSHHWEEDAHDYRAIAEGARVQFYWHLAGVGHSVSANYMDRQRNELDWIRAAIRAVSFPYEDMRPCFAKLPAALQISALRCVLHGWIEDQRNYFEQNSRRCETRLHFWHKLGNVMALAGLALVMLLAMDAWFHSDFAWLHGWGGTLFGIGVLIAVAWPFGVWTQQGTRKHSEAKHAAEKMRRGWLGAKAHEYLDLCIPTTSPQRFPQDRRRKLREMMKNFLLHLPAAFALAIATLGMVVVFSDRASNLPDAHNLTIVAAGCLLIVGAMAVAWTEKKLHSELAYQYHTMLSLFENASVRISRQIQRLASIDTANNRTEYDKKLHEIQAAILKLGMEALDENAEWLILHRARPLEPVMAG